MEEKEKIKRAIEYLENPSGKSLEDHQNAVCMAVQALKEKLAIDFKGILNRGGNKRE